MDLKPELKCAQNLALHGGAMALELRKKLTITQKPNGEGPVTNADILIDQYIVQELNKAFPNDRIISEESYAPGDMAIGSGRTWFIDPIDGTSSFMVGADDFVVMIGLAIDGIARMGVIFQPTHHRLWCGIFKDHNGSFSKRIDKKTEAPLHINAAKTTPAKLTLIASRVHPSKKQDAMIKRLNPHRIIYQSSVGLKGMMILDRAADIYVAWSRRIKLWDTCAPSAIVQAAGGTMSFLDGQHLSFSGDITHNQPILVANFAPDQKLLETLQQIASGV